ncbi:MAG: hypothetical protein KDC66_22025, partial [Phaeodactylibacter sp.]|nr:hypothetical protein [Phaeodactylibacter sp.]
MRWKITDRVVKFYEFGYGPLNRLLSGNYGEERLQNPTDIAPVADMNNYYQMSASYDAVGNIKSIIRRGMAPDAGCFIPQEIDRLTLVYDTLSNRLFRVGDLAPTPYRPYGFKPGASPSAEYVHDNNGNLTFDPHKGLNM